MRVSQRELRRIEKLLCLYEGQEAQIHLVNNSGWYCFGTCAGSCKTQCVGGCLLTCVGNCYGDCMGSCLGDCMGSCETGCTSNAK